MIDPRLAPRKLKMTRGGGGNSSSKHNSILGALLLLLLLLCAIATLALAAHAKSIEDLKSARALEFDVSAADKPTATTTTTTTTTLRPTTLRDIFDKLTSVFVATSSSTTRRPDVASDIAKNSTGVGSVEDADNKIPVTVAETTTTTTETSGDPEEGESDEAEEGDDGPACKGLASTDTDARGRPLTGAQRLVNLQTCMQAKVKRKLAGATRGGLELFEKLSLSGGCTASLMNLMTSMGELKAFAFKFLDASAKVPSGMMYGLLSDFGDFDQCLSIRSDARVDPRDEQEERAYSGKYCLLNVRLKYHVQLAIGNGSSAGAGAGAGAPEGIYPDGVLWDELVRNYWTTNSTKGFQVGVCVPSRCTSDDLDQIYKLMAESYYFDGQVQTCQDSNDLRRQQTPDSLQLAIIHLFLFVLALNAVGSLVERYWPCATDTKQTCGVIKAITCFSIQRNWRLFLRGHADQEPLIRPQVQVSENTANDRDIPARVNTPLLEPTELERRPPSEDYDSSFIDDTGSSASSTSGRPEVEAQVTASQMKQVSLELANNRQPAVKILPKEEEEEEEPELSCLGSDEKRDSAENKHDDLLSHLSGLKLLVIVWITAGHSFLYPSANNYQYYRSIINMNITRDSVWFATTNFTLGTDMLLYMTGLVFVCKLAHVASSAGHKHPDERARGGNGLVVLELIARRISRFWPTYLAVIALAIVIPLASDGPMWPEMVSTRLGATCRSRWWANVLMINNLFPESQVCLPSSWFLSVLMQCLLVGSLIMLVARRYSLKLALVLLTSLLFLASVLSFALAYLYQVGAPAIRMDETFVMELDGNIFQMYTNTFNNLGPFLVGMLGGFLLVRWRHRSMAKTTAAGRPPASPSSRRDTRIERLSKWMFQLNLAFAMALIAALVLSSVFFSHYTRFWAAIYWSCHRVGWALVTGYLVHQCATNRWRLLKDLLSLSSFIPLSRLIFIAYLVFPIFIHVHSGLVRDGLHVSIYNMLNIYITRLVMTFVTALAIHVLIELPLCSLCRNLSHRLYTVARSS